MLAGASGYIVKAAESHELLTALKLVASGGVYMHPSVARTALAPDRRMLLLDLDDRAQCNFAGLG